jgi:hypothetical protein
MIQSCTGCWSKSCTQESEKKLFCYPTYSTLYKDIENNEYIRFGQMLIFAYEESN